MDENRAAEVFGAAIEIENRARREEYVAAACGNDPELRQRVEELLRAAEDGEEFFHTGEREREGERPFEQVSEVADEVIGRYKLLQRIGEGGFGVVFMAEQQEPVRRRVALKIIKLGMDTKQVIARFEAERQALAMMDHPNIAKVLDAGAADSGRPYFVMELVKGVPIDDYCDKNHLSLRERLELFIPVGQALQHAHQKGVIHRDVKPSNVMVTLHDGKPAPMVIDFGVAKATQHRLTEKTLFTDYAQMLGTPAYMSPEQAEMSGLDVDTRTDVYSLGVLLYELLTGTTPFTAKELLSEGYAEMQRVIREVEPARPSMRMSTMGGEELTVIAKNRESRPEAMGRFLKGDLDWIVMKALEKDRTRRYQTAIELVADVRRHLVHEPVLATPPSQVYRLRKFVRRHRVGVAAGSALAATVALGACTSTWLAIRATQAEERAVSEAAISKAVNEFLLKDILGQANPWEADPGIGMTYSRLHEKQAAEPQLRAAYAIYRRTLNPEDPRRIAAQEAMGWLFRDLGKRAEAEQTFREVLNLRRETLGPEHPDTCLTMLALGFVCDPIGEAEPLFQEVLRIAHGNRGELGTLIPIALEGLGFIKLGERVGPESQGFYRQAYEMYLDLYGAAHQHTLRMKNLVAYHLWKVDGNVEQAEKMLCEVMETSRQAWGPGIYLSLNPAAFLADLLDGKGEHEEAERLMRQVVADAENGYGQQHAVTLGQRKGLGSHYARLGQWKAAAEVFHQLLDHDSAHGGDYSHAALSTWQSGDRKGARRLVDLALNRFGQTSDPASVLPLVETALVLDESVCSSGGFSRLFELAVTSCDTGRREAIQGFAAYRREDLATALRHLERLRSSPDARAAALAGFISSMALQRSGQMEAAVLALERADAKCESLLESGDLGSGWAHSVRCVVVRAEAEKTVLGQVGSLRVDDDFLRAARTRKVTSRTPGLREKAPD